MLIRSQDKECLFNYDMAISVEVNQTDINMATENRGVRIAKYSTKEKAIKVLDMIQEEYERHYYGEGGPYATMDAYVQSFGYTPPKVFQMPQDNEVYV